MGLLYFENYEVKVSPEALLVKPIRQIYNKDRTVNKESFMQQMSYMYFMIDPRSTYSYITDPKERSKAIIQQEGLPEDFKPSSLLEGAMEVYKKHTVTKSAQILESCMVAADKVREFLEKVNLFDTDKNEKPKYQVGNITTAIDKSITLVNKLKTLEKVVNQEIEEQTRAKGGTEKKMFEDGFNFNKK